MGQSQLLLIVVSVLTTSVAIVVGFTMYADSSAESNLDGVHADLLNMAGRAMRYYANPIPLGGGSRSFTGLTADVNGLAKLTSVPSNENGSYSIAVAGTDSMVVLEGVGVSDSDGDGTPVTVRATVTKNGVVTTVLSR